MTAAGGEPPPNDGALITAFIELAEEEGWRFTRIVTGDEWHGWSPLHRLLTAERDGDIPLAVAHAPSNACEACLKVVQGIAETGRGLAFSLLAPFGVDAPIDVAGRVGDSSGGRIDLSGALEMVRHPEGRLARRMLR